MTTLLTVLAVIVLLPVAGCVLLGLIGSIADHAPSEKPSGGWRLGLAYVVYGIGVLVLLGVFVPLLGGCMSAGVSMVCTAASIDPRYDITRKDCIQGFKDQAKKDAKPLQGFTGACPGTSFWNGVGCTTGKP